MRRIWVPLGIVAVAAALWAQAPYPQGQSPQDGQQDPQSDNAAPADEPGPAVARMGIVDGDVSVRRGDSGDWQAAAVNAPLMSGDRISVTAGGRAEIELDAAHFVRMAGDTEIRLADIGNGHYQVQIAHGLVTWRVLRATQAQAEMDTPLVGVHPGPDSTVRVEVDADGTSHITVRRGEADVSTQKGSEKVAENTTMDVRGSMDDPEFQVVAAAARDDRDNWSDQRDKYLLRAQSQRYVTEDVTGVEDLDPYGRWSYDPAYGWVWMPTVASSWAPYQNGQWVWEDYYGWTWVDYAPWGWAPFHYGYWYDRAGLGWAWYPGSRYGHVFWRPAMVGFFGWGGGGVGVGVGFGFGNIGWVALAPHEVFRPWYGRGGFRGAGLNAGVLRNANALGAYRNAGVAGGVRAVSAADFQRGNFRNAVAVDRGTLARASLVRGAVPITPTRQNLRFGDRVASVQSPRAAGMSNQRFFGGNASSGVRRTPFAQQQAAVRSAVGGAALRGETAGRAGSGPGSQSRGAGGQPSADWQRFESRPGNAGAAARGTNAAPGFDRFRSTPNRAPAAAPSGNSARPFQVSPSIIRQRPEAGSAPRGGPGGGGNRGGNRGGGSRGGRR